MESGLLSLETDRAVLSPAESPQHRSWCRARHARRDWPVSRCHRSGGPHLIIDRPKAAACYQFRSRIARGAGTQTLTGCGDQNPAPKCEGKADTHRSSRPDGNMATAMRPALLGRACVRAGVCARPTHRTLGERFFRRMLDNPADCAILFTSVDTNTTFVWRTCSHPDLPVPAYAPRHCR